MRLINAILRIFKLNPHSAMTVEYIMDKLNAQDIFATRWQIEEVLITYSKPHINGRKNTLPIMYLGHGYETHSHMYASCTFGKK